MKIPSMNWFLVANRDEVVEFLQSVCDQATKLWWYKKSTAPKSITLVSHIDTSGEKWSKWDSRKWNYETKQYDPVDPAVKKARRRLFYDQTQRVFWSPDGLGADDRAGVFTNLHIYNNLPDNLKPNLLFCDEEESGGAGAKAAAEELDDLKMSLALIELDRRGRNDCVFYNDEPKKFISMIEGFGFEKKWGSYSDISTIGRELEICGANLSIGYQDEHCKYEHLYVNWMLETYKKTMKIVEFITASGNQWVLPKKAKAIALPADLDYGLDGYGGLWHNEYWAAKGRAYYEKWAQGSRSRKGGGNGRYEEALLFKELEPAKQTFILAAAKRLGYKQVDLERNPYLLDWLEDVCYGGSYLDGP